jgi:S-adenosylmethionine decarboxylase
MQSFRPEQEGSMREDGRATTATVLHAGTEWLVDAAGCEPRQLSDLRHLQNLCAELVDTLRLRVIGTPLWHQFPSLGADGQPGGVTGLYLLAESHLTCHTFPEHGRAAFNLYCCRQRPAWDWEDFLGRWLGALHVAARSVPRGRLEPHNFPCEGQP